jgi:hypothetical protein
VSGRIATISDSGLCDQFLQVNQGPFEGYEGIFSARLFGEDRTQILLACIRQEFWRQNSKAGPRDVRRIGSPQSELVSFVVDTKQNGRTYIP